MLSLTALVVEGATTSKHKTPLLMSHGAGRDAGGEPLRQMSKQYILYGTQDLNETGGKDTLSSGNTSDAQTFISLLLQFSNGFSLWMPPRYQLSKL